MTRSTNAVDRAAPAEAVEDLYPSRQGDRPRLLPRRDPKVYGSPESGPLGDELLTYSRRGFLFFESLFDAGELAPYQAELDRLRGLDGIAREPHVVTEPGSGEVRSVFAVHENNEILGRLCRDRRIVEIARQLLGGDVYIHQSRVNYKPGFRGKEFYWHSDFETWHVEDGMPRMRAVSCSISLTSNDVNSGPLMLLPGSHHAFLSCAGETPENHYRQSLKKQEYGVPDDDSLRAMAGEHGIEATAGGVGSVTFFECNVMHGSSSNITPWPRSNLFVVFNSVENTLVDPFCGHPPRPEFIANRHDFSPIAPA